MQADVILKEPRPHIEGVGGCGPPPPYATAPPDPPPWFTPLSIALFPWYFKFLKEWKHESGIAIIEVFRAKMFELEIMISLKSDQWEAS